MHTILITGVGAIIGYGLVRSARASVHPLRVIGMDIDPDAVGRHWCDHFEQAVPAGERDYPQFIRDLILRESVDLVLPGIEQDVSRLGAELQSLQDLPVRFVLNTPELLKVGTDKWLTHCRLQEAGIPAIRTKLDGTFGELSRSLGLPFLAKPRRSQASKGIHTIFTGLDLDYCREQLGAEFMAQQIIGDDDSEYTVGVFGYGDGARSPKIVFQRRLGRAGHTVQARVVFLPELDAVIDRLTRLFKPLGPTNLQFRRHRGEFLLLEINPRFSSSGSMRSAFGFNEVDMCIEYYLYNRRARAKQIRCGSAIRYEEDMVQYDGIQHDAEKDCAPLTATSPSWNKA